MLGTTPATLGLPYLTGGEGTGLDAQVGAGHLGQQWSNSSRSEGVPYTPNKRGCSHGCRGRGRQGNHKAVGLPDGLQSRLARWSMVRLGVVAHGLGPLGLPIGMPQGPSFTCLAVQLYSALPATPTPPPLPLAHPSHQPLHPKFWHPTSE